MIHTNQADRADYLRQRINILEWDVLHITDEDLLKRRHAQLTALRSELDGLMARNN